MADGISICPAGLSDVPTLAAIRTEAAESSLLTHFQFSPYHSIATEKETEALVTRLSKRFTEPDGQRFYLVKAVVARNNEIIGWGLVKWEDESWVSSGAHSGAQAVAPEEEIGPSQPSSFGRYWSREVTKKWQTITGGKPHVSKDYFF